MDRRNFLKLLAVTPVAPLAIAAKPVSLRDIPIRKRAGQVTHIQYGIPWCYHKDSGIKEIEHGR